MHPRVRRNARTISVVPKSDPHPNARVVLSCKTPVSRSDGDQSLPRWPLSSRFSGLGLLAGVDQYSTRAEHLYDSLKVVSVDTKAKTIAMVSVPRDSSGYPLYFGGTGHIKINSIPTYVKNGWLDSPDEPLPTLVKEISYLVGVPINYYGVMDLGAFMKIIDLVGGVDINNDSAINDPSYDWMDGSPYGFALSAGPHHLNGRNALAYTSTATATAATSCLDLGKVAPLSVKLFGTESRYYGKKQPSTC